MSAALVIAGALLTCGACLAAGLILFQKLGLRFYRQETWALALLTGSAIYSTFVFAILAAHLAYEWVFPAASLAAIALCIQRRAHVLHAPAFPPIPLRWRVVLTAGGLAFGTFYLMHAMAPETSPDGSGYHLGLVARYLRQRGFGAITTSLYASFPMGMEMLFLNAFSTGKHSAAATTHLCFLLALTAAIVQYGRRVGNTGAGVTAGLIVFISPVFGVDGSSAYIDAGMAAVAFGCFVHLEVWLERSDWRYLIPAGLTAGFACACKATAFPIALYGVVLILCTGWRLHRKVIRPTLLFGLCAVIMVLPWPVKNFVVIGNPFSPFLNEWFPNPHVRIAMLQEYMQYLRTYEYVKSPLDVPLEVTLRGAKLQGLLGPVFLLVPLGLLGLREPVCRRALLAGLFMMLTYPANVGTRFLMGAAPFFALALATVLSRWPGMSLAVLLFHGVSSWPPVVKVYAAEGAWSLEEWRFEQAFRIEPEHDFLSRASTTYASAKLVEESVPPDGRVLTFGGISQAYCSRDVLNISEAGFNGTLGEIWLQPVLHYLGPTRLSRFRFARQKTRKLRLVQTAYSAQIWTVAELLVRSGAEEARRGFHWSVTATPNEWDAGMALDGSLLTRWKAWEASRPGMYVQVDFGGEQAIAGVDVYWAEEPQISMRVEMEVTPGQWKQVSDRPQSLEAPPMEGARHLATRVLNSYGITHLAVEKSNPLWQDMVTHQREWGVSLAGETATLRLYAIEQRE